MSKYLISRTSQWSGNTPPVPEAWQEPLTYIDRRTSKTLAEASKQHWYQQWYDATENHREEDGGIAGDRKKKSEEWVLEIPSLEEFVKDAGQIIVTKSDYKEIPLEVEIYDGWRE